MCKTQIRISVVVRPKNNGYDSFLLACIYDSSRTNFSLDGRAAVIISCRGFKSWCHSKAALHLKSLDAPVGEFPSPEMVNIDETYMRNEAMRLLKIIFREFGQDSTVLIAIDEAESMDDDSWLLIRQLSEEGTFVIMLSLSEDFRRPSISACMLLLKTYTCLTIKDSVEDYFASIVCWFLGVKAVEKELFRYLKKKTQDSTQLLHEVLLSPAVLEFTMLVPFDNLGSHEKKFFVSEFPVPEDQEKETVFACAKKPGVKLRDMKVPTNINDAVKSSFHFLTVQDRLLLKRAAILGPVFDQHVLEVVSHGIPTDQVSTSINNLLMKSILSFACTSGIILEKLPAKDPFKKLACYNVCFCSKVTGKSIFRNCQVPHEHAGPYRRLKFRTKVFRLCILSYMTREQYNTMRREIVSELEYSGLICVSCKSKTSESVHTELDLGDMRVTPVQTDVKQCACLEKRPETYNRLAYIQQSHGNKIFTVQYIQRKAQAAIDIGYPVQGLIYSSQALKLLPQDPDDPTLQPNDEEEKDVDLIVLRASLVKTKALSALLLGNYYYAGYFLQRSLDLLGMDTIYFHGGLAPRELKDILTKYRISLSPLTLTLFRATWARHNYLKRLTMTWEVRIRWPSWRFDSLPNKKSALFTEFHCSMPNRLPKASEFYLGRTLQRGNMNWP
ncbi:uncharacterized protein TNCV_1385341 [Trichonephila clavipes]|nr:uncharacterized protein TNCV_1385341 [Trichonephila clavipes]